MRNLLQSLRMAFTTIGNKKMRSFLTMLGTIIGVAAVISLYSVTKAQNAINKDLWMKLSKNTVRVYAYPYTMDSTVLGRDISNFINTELSDLTLGVTPEAQDWGKVISYGTKSVEVNNFSYGSEQYSICNSREIELGRDLCYMDMERGTNVVILGSYIKDILFNYQDPIGKEVRINGDPFTVVGVYKRQQAETDLEEGYEQYTMDNMVVVPVPMARKLKSSVQLTNYMVKANDAQATLEIVELLDEYLGQIFGEPDQWGNAPGGYYGVYSDTEYVEEQEQQDNSSANFATLIAAISLVVGGIGIMNIMLVTVTERTREIGIRKAIGAPRRSIVTQFLIEAIVLSGVGGLLGVIAGFIVTLFWGKMQYKIIAQPDLQYTVIAFVGSLALGIVFGLYPALKASRLQPVDALRTE